MRSPKALILFSGLLSWLAGAPALAGSHGSFISNAQSPMGFSIGGVGNFSQEQPFLNYFKSGGWWFGNTTALTITGVSQGASDPNHAGQHYVRVSLSSNAPVIDGTETASISNDLEVANYATATTVSASGTVLTISGPASGIAGTFGQNCPHNSGGSSNACLIQALNVSSGSIAANTYITFDANNSTNQCGGVACTGNGGPGTYGLSTSTTYSGGLQGSTNLVPTLHVTSITGTIYESNYLSAPANTGSRVQNAANNPATGTLQAFNGQTGTYYVCDGTCAQQTVSSQTILSSGIQVQVSGVTGPTEANGCGFVIPVNDGQSFDCVGVDYSGMTWGGTGQVVVLYNEYDYAYNLDSNGYPQSMTGIGPAAGVTMQAIKLAAYPGSALLNSAGINQAVSQPQLGPFYPAGQYLLQYTGGSGGCGGSISLSDGSNVTCAQTVSQGIDVYNVTPSTDGIAVTINNATGGYVHNVSLVYCGTYFSVPVNGSHCTTGYDSLLAQGEIFNPEFIREIRRAGTLRFMDWQQTNGTSLGTNWNFRPTLTQAFWGAAWNANQYDPMPSGPPIEAFVALCNEVQTDCWFNMPPLATDTWITNEATLVHNSLNSNLRAYVEFGNETWNGCNGSMLLFRYMLIASYAAFPNYDTGCGANEYYYESLRPQQARALWRSAWGSDSNRVFGVISGQGSANNGACDTNCTLLSVIPGFRGSSLTQWTNYSLPTSTASSTSATISGQVLTTGGTITGTFSVGMVLSDGGAHIGNAPLIDSNLGGGQYHITHSITVSSPETITAAWPAAHNADLFATSAYLDNCSTIPDWFTLEQFWTETNSGGLINSGSITSLGTITGGSGYTAGTYRGVSLTGGSGSGAQATIVVSGGAVTAVTPTVYGSSYVSSDTLSATAASIGGTGSGFSVPVTNISGGDSGFCPSGWLAAAVSKFQGDHTTAQAFLLPSAFYETGEQFQGGNTAITQLYQNAHRDPRMGQALASMWGQAKSDGVTQMNQFVDIAQVATPGASSFGNFGSEEQVLFGLSNIYRQDYIGWRDFNQANPCWWGSSAPWSNAGGCR